MTRPMPDLDPLPEPDDPACRMPEWESSYRETHEFIRARFNALGPGDRHRFGAAVRELGGEMSGPRRLVPRLPHPRFTIRRLMVAIAIVGALFGWLARPRPIGYRLGGGPPLMAWSDGTITAGGPMPKWRGGYRQFGPFCGVAWQGGGMSWYLRLPAPPRPIKWEDAPSIEGAPPGR